MKFLPLLLLCACIPCASRSVVTGADGGTAPCVQTSDCPRPSSTLLCTDELDHKRGCIACEDQQCVRYTPESCS